MPIIKGKWIACLQGIMTGLSPSALAFSISCIVRERIARYKEMFVYWSTYVERMVHGNGLLSMQIMSEFE